MRRSLLLLSASLIFAAGVMAACKQKTVAAEDPGDEEDAGETTPTPTPSGDKDADINQGTPAVPSNGIPCDVEAVLENRCQVCHGTVDPKGPPLLDFDDLMAKSTADPTKTRGQLVAEYMKAKTMPKAPAVATDAEITTVDLWVTGGMVKSTEACILTDGDGGTTDAGPTPDAGPDGGACTSGVLWTQGNTKSELMHPGGACIACHSANQGPALTFAGTVYPSLHEPNDCNGSKGPVTIAITDRRNKTVTMQVNAAGNFMAFTDSLKDLGLRPPYRVQLTAPGKAPRKMNQTITGGDCNSCHTQAGNGPPGRVLAP